MSRAELRVAVTRDMRFVAHFDLEARGGLGRVRLTSSREDALAMPFSEWWRWYRTSPACRPTTSDGKPNRPLAARVLMFELLDPPTRETGRM